MELNRGVTPPAGRTYYQRAGVTVTDTWLVIEDHTYRIDDLHRLQTVRGPHDPLAIWATSVAVVLAAAAGVVLSNEGFSVVSVVVALVALLPALFAVAAWRMQRRHLELWADYDGASTRLLRTYDDTAYGQIARALIRAKEAAAEGGERRRQQPSRSYINRSPVDSLWADQQRLAGLR